MTIYSEKSYKTDRFITVFMVFATSLSVGAWAIWQKLPWLWAAISMVSQSVALIRPHFPFAKRVSALKYYLPEVDALCIDMESDYLKMQIEDIDDNTIRKLILHYETTHSKISSKYIDSDLFSHNEKYEILANQRNSKNLEG